ncbi:MAG: phage head-tail connector protein [Polaromonas sp.]|nr:phage head-tail connector protein [Polaromonas sp.]
MALKLITAATVLAVDLVSAKAHLRVDVSDDDTLITAMITAATEAAEQMTGRALMAQTWELTLDAFPSALELTRVPVQSITSVTYADSTGASTVLAAPLYALDNADEFGFAYVVPVYAGVWPETRDEINAIKVRYVAGYADAASVPESIKSWIKLQVGAMYENRESEAVGQVQKMGFVDALLARYKVYA